ncbi:AlbA family DNA-binding domain-containing protein [Kribbella deserti]|uniref:Helix-turn-helix domain-containing protein n=1 Tax=Kribbella deserti TaxID=1926257 RepID=A0ABV6QS61_9ACTN
MTDEMVDAAVNQRLHETDDLDWKQAAPPRSGLADTDFPKDVAAMANGSGGVIVFGVTEDQKAAVGRVDVGEIDESHERALRSVAVTAINPPIFGLGLHRVGADGRRALVVTVPASVDGPHLIYKNQYFGAPVRNDADTTWMKERQIETMYRARFDERRNAHEALNNLYAEATAGRGELPPMAWMIGVARPRVPVIRTERMSREEAKEALGAIEDDRTLFARPTKEIRCSELNLLNPRPGLRRWVAPPNQDFAGSWLEAWASTHDDGSVTMAAAIGGHPIGSKEFAPPGVIRSDRVEQFTVDLMNLLRATATARGTVDYEARIGIKWDRTSLIMVEPPRSMGHTPEGLPLPQFTPVDVSVQAYVDANEALEQVRSIVTDLLNQGGLQRIALLRDPVSRSTD